MKIVRKEKNFEIHCYNGNCYYIVDNHGSCWASTETLKKANNRLEKILKSCGQN